MEILFFVLTICSVFIIIGLLLSNSDLKMDLNIYKNNGSCLRSNFVHYKVKGLETVYLNTLIQYEWKDYKILKEGILFKDLLYVDDEIYTNLKILIKIK